MFTYDSHATGGSHVTAPPGTIIANKYKVVREAGTGNFARVFQCVNTLTNQPVAVKILKKGFERDADFEEEILRAVNATDPDDQQGLVKLVERADWNRHAMLVFALKGEPLRSVRLPMSKDKLYSCVRDVAEALAFLHYTVKAVHTDLKPENILAELSPSGGEASKQREWCVCDFGSASFFTPGKLDMDLITTRPYRAPEVVLSRGWSAAADAWSLGCVMYELRTGRKLFDCQTDADHLDLIQRRLGAVPPGMQTGRYHSFVAAARGLGGAGGLSGRAGGLGQVQLLKDELRDDPTFLGLLLSLLAIDPTQRARCDDVARKAKAALQEVLGVATQRPALSSISDVFRNAGASAALGRKESFGGAADCENSNVGSFRANSTDKPSQGLFATNGSSSNSKLPSRMVSPVMPSSASSSSARDNIENMLASKCFVSGIGQQQQQQSLISPSPLSASLGMPGGLKSHLGTQQQSTFGSGNPYSSTYRVAYV